MTIKEIIAKKRIFIPCTIILFYTLTGFFFLPYFGKNILQDKLSKALNRQATIEKIRINPYTLTTQLDSLVVQDKDKKTFVSFEKIYINLSLSSLFTLGINVAEFNLEKPYIRILQNKDKTFNFSDLIPSDKKESPDKPENSNIINFNLNNVSITQGKIEISDKVNEVLHSVDNFSLSLPFLSSKSKYISQKANLDIGFVLNKSKVKINIESTPFAEDLSSDIHIKTSDIDIIHYLSYIPIPLNLKLKDLGLNCDLHARYQKRDSDNSLLLDGKIGISNLDLQNSLNKEIIKFHSLNIDILKSDILNKKLNISKILITMPQLNINRDQNGKIDLEKYFVQEKEITLDSPPQTEETNPFYLTLTDFEIKEGAILFQDNSNAKEFSSKIFPLNIEISNFQTGETISGEYSLNLLTESKEKVDSHGKFQTEPLQADGSINISNILLAKYVPYYEKFVNFDLTKGNTSLIADFKLLQENSEYDIVINNREFLLETLSIKDIDSLKEIINIPKFQIKNSTIDLKNKKISTGTISANDGKIFIQRREDNSINLIQSVSTQNATTQNTSDQNKTADSEIAKNNLAKNLDTETKLKSSEIVPDKNNNSSNNKEMPWAIILNDFNFNNFNLEFSDLSNTKPIKIDVSKISVKADNIENTGTKHGNIDVQMNWNENGRISIKGELTPSILSSNLDINFERIDIKSLQPYFTDFIKIVVTSGDINTKGKLGINLKDMKNPAIKFNGKTSITNFVSLDKEEAKDFFKCKALNFSGLDVLTSPISLKIKGISLTDFYSRIIVHENGKTNLSTIFEPSQKDIKEPETDTDTATDTIPPEIFVENITLQGGNINFSDYFTKPNFSANMKELTGSITKLSSDPAIHAPISLKGIHGESSPLEIAGEINPLAEKKYIDLNFTFKDIELAKFTPYSSKYLGYKIKKGKLILDLKYLIDGKKLNSENKVLFDNLTFGESVESEQATSLPVKLAISLLKDKNGQISLDLPVTGQLDDPEFKIGSIVLKILGNLILKVVTSPFSIIGAMVGGGEEMAYVEFENGKHIITDSNLEKIDKLAQILEAKPSIKLEIQGFYDKIKDSEGLKIKNFTDSIKSVKLKEMIAAGSNVATLDEISLNQEDIEEFVKTAYTDATFPKPKDKTGKEKKIDITEQEKLLITNITVNQDELRLLAMKRSQVVKAYLLTTEKVEKERVFLLEPSESNDQETEQTSKVQFLLK